jgi:excinuclease ABC subunit A
VVDIDQSPIGRTPRSNPATYTGLFTPIRELFAQTPEAKARGYSAGRFSFNVKGGRCEACEGDGMIKVAMHFLPDMYVPCDACHGKRYNRETLEVGYKGKNISDVLEMTVEDAAEFFSAIPVIHRRLDTLMQVGLGYIRLGQAATTLSGGEAQRVKLARELAKRDTGKTLYILDEPTTGLHFHDIAKLLDILYELRNKGNTIVVIEHNLDVIKTADWVIDLVLKVVLVVVKLLPKVHLSKWLKLRFHTQGVLKADVEINLIGSQNWRKFRLTFLSSLNLRQLLKCETEAYSILSNKECCVLCNFSARFMHSLNHE